MHGYTPVCAVHAKSSRINFPCMHSEHLGLATGVNFLGRKVALWTSPKTMRGYSK